MNSKSVIPKIIKRITEHRSGFYDKRTTHPAREWLIGLLVFTLVIVAGSIQSAHTFLRYQNIRTEGGVYAEKIPEYNKVVAQNIVASYTQRQESFNQALQHVVAREIQSEVHEEIPVTGSTTPSVVSENNATSTAKEEPMEINLAN